MKSDVKVRMKRNTKWTRTTDKIIIREVIMGYARSFCSYIKQGERGRQTRRAISSANVLLRMFLYATEHFHLELAKDVAGNTISIGGQEKMNKIESTLAAASLPSQVGNLFVQLATEDATKWNETLSPLLFFLMHQILFNDEVRAKYLLPPVNDRERMMLKIFDATFTLMSLKRIYLGIGINAENEFETTRLPNCRPIESEH